MITSTSNARIKRLVNLKKKSGGTDRYRILTCVRYQDPAGHPVRGGADESQNQRTDFSRVSADHGIRSSAGSG